MQALILDGVADMQMAEHLAIQSQGTRLREGIIKLLQPLPGAHRVALAEFMGQMFCGYWIWHSVRKPLPGAPLRLEEMLRRNLVPEPVIAPPPQLVQLLPWTYDDFCPLEECKLIYPTSADNLTMSGVPAEFLSPRTSAGYYGCLFGDCGKEISPASPRLLLMCAGNTWGSPLGATSAVADTISRQGWHGSYEIQTRQRAWYEPNGGLIPRRGMPLAPWTSPTPTPLPKPSPTNGRRRHPVPMLTKPVASAEKTHPEAEGPELPPKEIKRIVTPKGRGSQAPSRGGRGGRWYHHG